MGAEQVVEVQDERVLVLAPVGRDGTLAAEVLVEAGLPALSCPDAETFLTALAAGAGAGVLAQEALTAEFTSQLGRWLTQQPSWSDFPLVLFTVRKASAFENRQALEVHRDLGNFTALERPVHPATLVSAVRSALRGRRRQYHSRDVLRDREREVHQRDQFLAMLGHELRNPLAAMLSAKELADRAGGATPGLARPLGVIGRQIHHLHQLVDDLLDVARVTSGKIALKRVPLDLGQLVTEVVAELWGNGRSRQQLVKVKVPPQPVPVLVDPVRMEQVIGNILTNATKYTPPGGSIAVTVTQQTGAEGRQAVLRVSDTGVGMTPEMLETVFEPFTQADRTLERAQGGMGLGLTVVHRLVALHGGDVRATSAGLGLGSEFTVRVPLIERPASEAHPNPAARPDRSTPSPSRPRNVLIVEDSADIRESLQELLEGLGHRVEAAADGEQALIRALSHKPDVALVDIGLPRIDGYEVARRMREALGTDVLLLALTGYGQPEDRARAAAAGFDLHLTKPVELATLELLLSGPGIANPAASVQAL
jgi:signal transduction histidine kinase/ActR/RegA family two-component response regulator